jgi:hypothetical protein
VPRLGLVLACLLVPVANAAAQLVPRLDLVGSRVSDGLVSAPRLSSGAARRFGDLVLSLSASERAGRVTSLQEHRREEIVAYTRFDTLTGIWDTVRTSVVHADTARTVQLRHWSELEAMLSWERSRFVTSLAVSARPRINNVPGAAWVSADLALRLAAPISLVLGASSGGRSRDITGQAQTRALHFGLRLAPRFRREEQVLPAAIYLAPVGTGSYRIDLRMPNVERVELSGDFTDWKPVALTRIGPALWTVTLPMRAGTHRLNIRVNGGAWVAPPGLVAMRDDFAGEVGVVVVQ